MTLSIDGRSVSARTARMEVERANRRADKAMSQLEAQNQLLRKTQRALDKKNHELSKLMDAIKSGKIDTLYDASTESGAVSVQDASVVVENERLIDELKRSNKNFNLFAYAAAHDLKAPLRHITGFIDVVLMQEGNNLSPEGLSKLDYVQVSAKKLTQLIDRLLEYAKVDSRPKNFTTVHLTQVMQHVVANNSEDIKDTQAQIECGELPSVEGDEVLLYQLFHNVFSNALKYRRQGINPHVVISSEPVVDASSPIEGASPSYRILIKDNGIGFDEEYLDKVFQAFMRLVSADEFEGSGIGMAIAQKIVVIHNGSITAESQPGYGSTFIITLPSKQQGE